MTWVRPARPWAPIAVSVLFVFIWWVVAHNSGSGWVQFLGDAAFGTILVGILGPAIVTCRSRFRLVDAPTDGSARVPVFVQLSASTRLRVRPIEPPGPDTFIGPTSRGKIGDTEITLLPTRRGVYPAILIEIASAAPFGLQWWSRKVTVPLKTSLLVAPRRGEPLPLPRLNVSHLGDTARPVRTRMGDPHSVRPYQPGDQRRQLHWPATAHTGQMMVRESEEPSAQPITLKLSLPYDDEAAERATERALGTAMAVLDRGAPLILATDEQSGPVVEPVADRIEAGRRLARATSSQRSAQSEFLG